MKSRISLIKDNSNKKRSTKAFMPFLVSVSFYILLIWIAIYNRSYAEKLTMERLIMEKSLKVNEVITDLLYKTHALSALVLQSNG